jgi:hypothetical protein
MASRSSFVIFAEGAAQFSMMNAVASILCKWQAGCICRSRSASSERALIAIALVILPFLGRSSAQGRKVHHDA